MTALSQLCVVVPIGPGERAWRELLPQLAPLPAQARVVLVATSTRDLPRRDDRARAGLRAGVVGITTERGRALQQNAGARVVQRRFLWFLHADSRLSPATLPALAQALQAHPDALGYFDLRFLRDGPAAVGLNEIGAFVRSRCFGLPFGDQGLFLQRAHFWQLGGFDPTLAYGEDHALVWAARRADLSIVPARAPIYTSARKYAEHGWVRTTARHVMLTAAQIWRESRIKAAA